MASDIRAILNHVPPSSLRAICEARGLPTGGDQNEKRSRLARSFRGDLEDLLPYLDRKDMIAALGDYTYYNEVLQGQLLGLGRANRDDLVAMMRKVFAEDWSPTRDGEYPLGRRSSIRFGAYADEDGDDDAEDGDDDLERKPDTHDGEERSIEDSFLRWLADYLSGRDRTNLLVKTLVNRLGRFTADQRLTIRAVLDLARVLAGAGYVTEPDLSAMSISPGIGQRVTVRSRGLVDPRPELTDWHPAPAPDGGVNPDQGPRPVQGPHAPLPTSDFERAALKLQFLALVTAAIHRPDEAQRRLAVDLATHGTSLGAADQIRLRALAHQYASGHGDLNHVVVALRTTLPPADRRQLLDDVRSLAPPTAELDELVAVYATDLNVSLDHMPLLPTAAPPQPPVAVAPEPGAAEPPVEAGGVRANPALDALFAMEPQ